MGKAQNQSTMIRQNRQNEKKKNGKKKKKGQKNKLKPNIVIIRSHHPKPEKRERNTQNCHTTRTKLKDSAKGGCVKRIARPNS